MIRRAKGGRFDNLVRAAIADQPTTVVAIIEHLLAVLPRHANSSPDMSVLFDGVRVRIRLPGA